MRGEGEGSAVGHIISGQRGMGMALAAGHDASEWPRPSRRGWKGASGSDGRLDARNHLFNANWLFIQFVILCLFTVHLFNRFVSSVDVYFI